MFSYFCDNTVASGMDAGDFYKISQTDLSRDFCECVLLGSFTRSSLPYPVLEVTGAVKRASK